MTAQAAIPPAFRDLAFEEPERAGALLEALLAHGAGVLAEPLQAALAETAAPGRALLGLKRYIDNTDSPGDEAVRLAADPACLRMLLRGFWQSHFLTDILARHPDYLHWLWRDTDIERPRTRDVMLAELVPEDGFESFEACCDALRQFRRREILRIGLREVAVHAPVEETVVELSDLADASLEAALEAARAEVDGRYGRPRTEGGDDASYVVLGMGKLGGRELNFSSDIDLLFVYSEDGTTAGGRQPPVSNAQYFQKLSERLIKAISEQTAEGLAFRIDMRLRPHGRVGPLAFSLDSGVDYYGDYGSAWERQALIKARPCAGDHELGHTFIERLRPFVFPKYFDDETLEEIRSVKARAEAIIAQQGKTDREVKLGHGGIRDIEFTVQMLQLLNGGRDPALRTANTQEAITVLGRDDYISPLEAETLSTHYWFLRRVEHRLQIEGGQQRHALPEDETALDDLARRLGFEDRHAFLNLYRERAGQTRAILDRFLAAKGSGHLWLEDLLNPHSEAAAGRERLQELGFNAPDRAREHLLRLACGTSDRPFPRHVRQQFAAIAPALLKALENAADPDNVLARLSDILFRLSAPAVLYDLLNHNPGLHEYLVKLVENSDYLCRILARDPGLFDILSGPGALTRPSTRRNLEEELAALRQAYDSAAAPYRLRDGEMLRIAMRELVKGISVLEVGDELTLLAEVILEDVLAGARKQTAHRYGACAVPFAILGVGKLGGWEMGYGSDLDLIFVYDAEAVMDLPMTPSEYFATVASKTLKQLKEPGPHGILYNVDARLRPDGAKGVLAISQHRLKEYFVNEAQEWERFALMKGRFVAGDPEFGRQVEEAAKDAAFSFPLDRPSLEHFEHLRQRMVEHATPLDLKKSEGAISEIEYIVRFWQLQHVEAYPALRRGDVYGATDILASHSLIADERLAIVRESYVALRWILNRIRMMDGTDRSTVPEQEEARAALARRLGLDEPLDEFLRRHKQRVHGLYTTVFQETLGTHDSTTA